MKVKQEKVLIQLLEIKFILTNIRFWLDLLWLTYFNCYFINNSNNFYLVKSVQFILFRIILMLMKNVLIIGLIKYINWKYRSLSKWDLTKIIYDIEMHYILHYIFNNSFLYNTRRHSYNTADFINVVSL